MIQIKNLVKTYPNQVVFDQLDLRIKKQDKMAIVGANGVGKTTLFRIIDGSEPYDSGDIRYRKNLRLGFMEQIHRDNREVLLEDYLKKAYEDLVDMRNDLEKLEEQMGEDHSEEVLMKYAELQERFLYRGGYDIDYEQNNLLTHFGFSSEDLHRDIRTFSGGQMTRLSIVRLLLSKPDILFLDEPTNHLDLDTIEWLESYLQSYQGTVVIVSHDRRFIDKVCNTVVEISSYQAHRYEGNYSQYQIERKRRVESDERKKKQVQKEIARLEKQIDRFRQTNPGFVHSKEKYIERIQVEDKAVEKPREFSASFQSKRRGGQDVLVAQKLAIGYDEPLLTIDLDLKRGRRYAVIGPNGSGKSTLLKTIAKKIDPLGGDFLYGHQIDVGYFDQDLYQFNPQDTVLQAIWYHFPDLTITEIRQALAQFLFTSEDIEKTVSVLSGGERVRLSLLYLMLSQDNFLILDEPSNHMDLYAREAFEEALERYDGTVLFVSHDRYFVDKIATDLLIIDNGEVYHSEQSFEKHKKEEEKKVDAEKEVVKQTYEQRKKLKNRKQKLESLLEELQEDLEAHRESRFDPEFYHDFEKMEALNDAIDDIHNDIAKAEEEWLEITLMLEEK